MTEHERAVIEAAEAYEVAFQRWFDTTATAMEAVDTTPKEGQWREYAVAAIDHATAKQALVAAVRAKREAGGR